MAARTVNQLIVELTTSHTPQDVLEETLKDGTLAQLIPELACLNGVVQNPTHHAEVDTFLHMKMVMQVAVGLTNRPRARFAALMHDLGKGVTPREEWPKHILHEERGVPIVEALCKRLDVPPDWATLGMLTSKWHLNAHQAQSLRPRSIVKMFVETGFIDDQEMFSDFLIACEADKRGRGGMMDTTYPQAALLRAAMLAVNQVPDDDDPQVLYENRCAAVKKAIKQFQ